MNESGDRDERKNKVLRDKCSVKNEIPKVPIELIIENSSLKQTSQQPSMITQSMQIVSDL
jgi:hypothetical protein